MFLLFTYIKSQIQRNDIWQKLSYPIEESILVKISKHKTSLSSYLRESGELISICGGTGGYWLRAFDEKVSSREYRERFTIEGYSLYLCAILNSSLFYWFWRKLSNSRHLNKKDIAKFTFDFPIQQGNLKEYSKRHLSILKATKEHRTGALSYDQYRPAKAKREVDAIDTLLAQHYGFTEEELDYIINYDIKYRMGINE